MLIFIRDASCSTQPLELLNTIGLENLEKQAVFTRDAEVHAGDTPQFSDIEQSQNHKSVDSSAVDSARNHYSPSTSDQDVDMHTNTDSEG